MYGIQNGIAVLKKLCEVGVLKKKNYERSWGVKKSLNAEFRWYFIKLSRYMRNYIHETLVRYQQIRIKRRKVEIYWAILALFFRRSSHGIKIHKVSHLSRFARSFNLLIVQSSLIFFFMKLIQSWYIIICFMTVLNTSIYPKAKN